MQMKRDNIDGSVLIHQSKYVKEILKHFNMSSAKHVNVPLDPNGILQPVRATNYAVKLNFQCREAIGALIFLAIVTCLDLAFAINL